MCSIHSLETHFIYLEKGHYSCREVTKRYITLKETAGYKDQHLPFVSSIFFIISFIAVDLLVICCTRNQIF